MGIMPGSIYLVRPHRHRRRSGTLGYEAASQMKALGIGVSTSLVSAATQSTARPSRTCWSCFEQDPNTDAVLMIGEIGGPQEAEAALWARDHMKKPLIAYIAGLSAPKGRRMGHAGAIISAFGESAQEKVEILKSAGVAIVPTPSSFGDTVADVLSAMGKAA